MKQFFLSGGNQKTRLVKRVVYWLGENCQPHRYGGGGGEEKFRKQKEINYREMCGTCGTYGQKKKCIKLRLKIGCERTI
jgi:hypothetical protein